MPTKKAARKGAKKSASTTNKSAAVWRPKTDVDDGRLDQADESDGGLITQGRKRPAGKANKTTQPPKKKPKASASAAINIVDNHVSIFR